MVIGGFTSSGFKSFWINDVTLIDPEKNKTCQLTPYPIAASQMTGGLIEKDGQQTPVVCGGFPRPPGQDDKCYRFNSGEWEEFYNLSGYGNRGWGLNAAPINRQWLFINGLDQNAGSLLLNGEGMSFDVQPPISSAFDACSVVELNQGTYRIIAVLGGRNLPERKWMERFNCTGRHWQTHF